MYARLIVLRILSRAHVCDHPSHSLTPSLRRRRCCQCYYFILEPLSKSMCHLHRFFAALMLAWTCLAEEMSPPPSRVYQMYHAFRFEDDTAGTFLPRGSITLTPSSGGELSMTVTEDDSVLLHSREDFDNLVKTGGLYRIKLVDAENPLHSIIVSTSACNVRRANFREEISLMLSHTGTLISASYRPLVSKLAPSCTALSPLSESPDVPMSFKTTVSYSLGKPAMTIPLVLPHMRPPPGYNWFQRSVEGGAGGDISLPSAEGKSPFVDPAEKAENQQYQQKGFFQRYWYVIIPLSMILISGGGDDKRGTKGDSRSQSGSAGVANTSPASDGNRAAPIASSSDTLKQRRGKTTK